jgi:hypothetical protein
MLYKVEWRWDLKAAFSYFAEKTELLELKTTACEIYQKRGAREQYYIYIMYTILLKALKQI